MYTCTPKVDPSLVGVSEQHTVTPNAKQRPMLQIPVDPYEKVWAHNYGPIGNPDSNLQKGGLSA